MKCIFCGSEDVIQVQLNNLREKTSAEDDMYDVKYICQSCGKEFTVEKPVEKKSFLTTFFQIYVTADNIITVLIVISLGFMLVYSLLPETVKEEIEQVGLLEDQQQVPAENSMIPELQPVGSVNLDLPKEIEQYTIGSKTRLEELVKCGRIAGLSCNKATGEAAYEYIVSAFPHYYDSSDRMERVIYCGMICYLYFDKDSDESRLGYNVYYATRHVYTGRDTVNSEATLMVLNEMNEMLHPVLSAI